MRNVLDSIRAALSGLRDRFVALSGRNKGIVAGASVVVLVVIGVGAAAVFGGGGETTPTTLAAVTTTTPTTTTTLPATTTTTTTTIAGLASPLNGLAADDPALLERRALAVKIDNHPNARPQSGIAQADLVYELLVEGGLSRFIAIFHDNDSEYLGPIRSGRPTDPTLIRPTGAVMVFSGAQPWIEQIIVNTGVRLIGEGEGTFRIQGRSAPHNLYGDTLALRAVADARGYGDDPPPAILEIGEYEGQEPAAQVATTWDAGNRVLWLWNGSEYQRFTNELPHNEIDIDGNETQIATDVLVVLEAVQYTARPPGDGTPVPALETVGEGVAYVFANGMVQEGSWSRADNADPFTLRAADGGAMTVPAGRPWIAIFPNSQPVSWLAEATS